MMVSPTISEVVLGHTWIKPEYPSFYPEELVLHSPHSTSATTVERLYVCPWCFKYTQDVLSFRSHMDSHCSFRDVRGCFEKWIYEDTKRGIGICEIDGEELRLFGQNLCLFSKLFLDTKSVFYDVTTFVFYLLVFKDPAAPKARPQVIGFFSKEKLSWDHNNLACILVFPPWQRRGFGQVLMGISYLLSRREKRIGGPEKPLSELGRCAYIHFWAGMITRHVLSLPAKKPVTIREISNATYIMPEDVLMTCKEMQILETRKKNATTTRMVMNKAKVKAYAEAHRIKMQEPVDVASFDELNPPEESEEDENGEEDDEVEDASDEG